MTSHELMTNKELLCALMRGDKKSLKRGYTPRAAMDGLVTLRGELETEEKDKLKKYAEGFQDGMMRTRPHSFPSLSRAEQSYYSLGYEVGLLEPMNLVLPASRR